VFIFNRDCVLLIKQKDKNKPGYEKWNGLGGHVERGENPLDSARREIWEESGLKVENIKLKYITFIEENNQGICLFIFSGYSKNSSLVKSDEGDVRWFSEKEIKDLVTMNDLPELLNVIKRTKRNKSLRFLDINYKNGKVRIDSIN